MLASIELVAARLLRGHAPESVLAETTAHDEFEDARRQGHLWIARANDVPVGFAHVKILEPDVAHLEEIDVHPDHGRRGIGTRLVSAVCEWAAREGYDSVTLTTFRDVRWNMPFYERLGFHLISPSQLSAALCSILEDEARRGLDPARRVAMRLAVGACPAEAWRRQTPPELTNETKSGTVKNSAKKTTPSPCKRESRSR